MRRRCELDVLEYTGPAARAMSLFEFAEQGIVRYLLQSADGRRALVDSMRGEIEGRLTSTPALSLFEPARMEWGSRGRLSVGETSTLYDYPIGDDVSAHRTVRMCPQVIAGRLEAWSRELIVGRLRMYSTEGPFRGGGSRHLFMCLTTQRVLRGQGMLDPCDDPLLLGEGRSFDGAPIHISESLDPGVVLLVVPPLGLYRYRLDLEDVTGRGPSFAVRARLSLDLFWESSAEHHTIQDIAEMYP